MLALSPHATATARTRVVLQRRQFLERELARERKTLADFAAESGPMAVPGKLMVTLTVRQFELELAWLNDVEATLATALESASQ